MTEKDYHKYEEHQREQILEDWIPIQKKEIERLFKDD